MISKDRLATFDPAIKDYYFSNGMINIVLHQNTVVVNFRPDELEVLLKELKENS